MFDEQSTATTPTAGVKPMGATPPNGLPIGNGPANLSEPEDILGDIDQSQPAVQRPAQSTTVSITPPPAMPAESAVESAEPFFKRHQKMIVILFIILVAGGALVAAGWYAYGRFFSPSTTGQIQSPVLNRTSGVPTTNQNGAVNQPSQNQNVAAPAPVVVDRDHDGLTDAEEALYGTDPTKVDSDNDGLTDRDEVKVFKTDPNNPDSDGDGYTDGVEVRNGFNPKGPGKLLQLP